MVALREQLQRARPSLFMLQVPGAKKIQMDPFCSCLLPSFSLEVSQGDCFLCVALCVAGRFLRIFPTAALLSACTHHGPDSQHCRYHGLPSVRGRCCLSQGSLSKRGDSSGPNPTPRMEVCQRGGHLRVLFFRGFTHASSPASKVNSVAF